MGIWNAVKTTFSWIVGLKELWNKLFSSEGTVSIKTAYEEGEKADGESFDKDQKGKKDGENNGEPQEVKVVEDDVYKSTFDVGKGSITPPTVGGVAAEKTRKKSKSSDGTDSGNSKISTLNIGKMVERLNVYTQKGSVSESKEQIIQAIKEVFGTAVADFAGITNGN